VGKRWVFASKNHESSPFFDAFNKRTKPASYPPYIRSYKNTYVNICRLVTASKDSTVRVWEVRTGECLHVLQGHVGTVRCVDFDGYKGILAYKVSKDYRFL
jgi:WD40 repeat protein